MLVREFSFSAGSQVLLCVVFFFLWHLRCLYSILLLFCHLVRFYWNWMCFFFKYVTKWTRVLSVFVSIRVLFLHSHILSQCWSDQAHFSCACALASARDLFLSLDLKNLNICLILCLPSFFQCYSVCGFWYRLFLRENRQTFTLNLNTEIQITLAIIV